MYGEKFGFAKKWDLGEQLTLMFHNSSSSYTIKIQLRCTYSRKNKDYVCAQYVEYVEVLAKVALMETCTWMRGYGAATQTMALQTVELWIFVSGLPEYVPALS